MSRSKRRPKFKGYNKECTTVKRITMKLWKRRCRYLVRIGRFDDLPRKVGTQGWITH